MIKINAETAEEICYGYGGLMNFCDNVSDEIMRRLRELRLPFTPEIRFRPHDEPDWDAYPVMAVYHFNTGKLTYEPYRPVPDAASKSLSNPENSLSHASPSAANNAAKNVKVRQKSTCRKKVKVSINKK